mmetsp:Transcript_27861/g.83065  ORF Transcript_27861/g.83065 Transcript_27861/m.83065 type:complete len:481 (-) Transcript_27861:381-1823(-)
MSSRVPCSRDTASVVPSTDACIIDMSFRSVASMYSSRFLAASSTAPMRSSTWLRRSSAEGALPPPRISATAWWTPSSSAWSSPSSRARASRPSISARLRSCSMDLISLSEETRASRSARTSPASASQRSMAWWSPASEAESADLGTWTSARISARRTSSRPAISPASWVRTSVSAWRDVVRTLSRSLSQKTACSALMRAWLSLIEAWHSSFIWAPTLRSSSSRPCGAGPAPRPAARAAWSCSSSSSVCRRRTATSSCTEWPQASAARPCAAGPTSTVRERSWQWPARKRPSASSTAARTVLSRPRLRSRSERMISAFSFVRASRSRRMASKTVSFCRVSPASAKPPAEPLVETTLVETPLAEMVAEAGLESFRSFMLRSFVLRSFMSCRSSLEGCWASGPGSASRPLRPLQTALLRPLSQEDLGFSSLEREASDAPKRPVVDMRLRSGSWLGPSASVAMTKSVGCCEDWPRMLAPRAGPG